MPDDLVCTWPTQFPVAIHSKARVLITFYLQDRFFYNWNSLTNQNTVMILSSTEFFKYQELLPIISPFTLQHVSPHIYLKCAAVGYVSK